MIDSLKNTGQMTLQNVPKVRKKCNIYIDIFNLGNCVFNPFTR